MASGIAVHQRNWRRMSLEADQRSLLSRYLQGPALLEQAVADLSDADLDAPPSDGGWTIRQIVHHVVDGDDLWMTCIKAALGNEEDDFTLEWYWQLPQDTWAERWGYAHRPLDVSLALFGAIRAHIAQLVERAPDGWSRSMRVRTPQGTERVSVRAVLEMQADHVSHHVERIAAIRAERGDA
ncbi:MAG: DinB family protein [Gemmatimonadota bacterium]